MKKRRSADQIVYFHLYVTRSGVMCAQQPLNGDIWRPCDASDLETTTQNAQSIMAMVQAGGWIDGQQ